MSGEATRSLVERLRAEMAWYERQHQSGSISFMANLLREAADQIEADAERIKRLSQAAEATIADLSVAMELIEQPATDPMAWIDGARERLRCAFTVMATKPPGGRGETRSQLGLRALQRQFEQSASDCEEQARRCTVMDLTAHTEWKARSGVWDLAARCVKNLADELEALLRDEAIVGEEETLPACESECNPFIARCGAEFCSYEAMAHHNSKCSAPPQSEPPA